MMKNKNLFHTYKPILYNFFKNGIYPLLKINSVFVSNNLDKSFYIFDEVIDVQLTIKINLEDKRTTKFFQIKNSCPLFLGNAKEVLDKTREIKKTCIIVSENTFKFTIVYCIPIFLEEQVIGVMYGHLNNIKDLDFVDSPVILKNKKITVDVERIFLENIDERDFVNYLSTTYFSNIDNTSNIYVISTKKDDFIYKKENLDIKMTFEKVCDVYKHSDSKKIIIDNIYKISFYEVEFGDNFYIVAKVGMILYDSTKLLKSSFAV